MELRVMESVITTDIMDRYLQKLMIECGKKNTVNNTTSDLKKFYLYMMKETGASSEIHMLKSITYDLVEDYIFHSLDTLSKATTNRYISSIKKFFEYVCNSKRILDVNPFTGIKQMTIRSTDRTKTKEILTVDEVKKIINSTYTNNYDDRSFEFAAPRNRFIISMLFTTGLRINELLSTTLDDIELAEDGKNYMLNVNDLTSKNSEAKRVPICGETLKYYNEYMKVRETINVKSNTVVLSIKGKKLTSNSCNDMIKKYVDKSEVRNVYGEIKHISNHCLRHSAATRMTGLGVGVDIIAKLMGWSQASSSIDKMMKIYTRDSAFDQLKINVCEKMI